VPADPPTPAHDPPEPAAGPDAEAGILLAAGSGSRMGGPKALLTVHGERLVERGARMLAAAGCAPVLVVLGADADRVESAAALDGVTVVRCAGWAEGMGASLRAGLAAAAATGAAAAVIALADQPGIGAAAVRRLRAAWHTAPAGIVAVVAGYAGRPRNPALISREAWPQVADLARGDTGARAWLRAHPDRVLQVPCDDLAGPEDLDTPDDLARYRAAGTDR
jgi:CTP:molybdopterin cytidylyltransferase MocA